MTLSQSFRAALAVLTLAMPASAHTTGNVEAVDAYARTTPRSGAVFLVIENHTPHDDRLLSATTEAAEKAELHTSKTNDAGVAVMEPLPDGIAVPSQAKHALKRGGDHIMLMGLKQPLKQGDTIRLVLTFEVAGEVAVEAVVDNDRKEDAGAEPAMDHSGHGTPSN